MFLTPIEVRCTNQLSNENKLPFCNWCNPLEEISNFPYDYTTSPVSQVGFALRMWRYSNSSYYGAYTQRIDPRFLSQGLSIQQQVQVFRGEKTKLKTSNFATTTTESPKNHHHLKQMLFLLSLLNLVEPIFNT